MATQVAPIYPLYIRDGEGNIMIDKNGFTVYDFGDKNNAGLKRPFLPGANPFAANLLDTNNAEGNAMTATGFAEIRFLKDFKFTWTSGVNIDETGEMVSRILIMASMHHLTVSQVNRIPVRCRTTINSC